MNLTQKQFNSLIEILNHRITNMENDIKWIKKIGYWMAGIITTSLIVNLRGLI